jgi:hypothetical protein
VLVQTTADIERHLAALRAAAANAQKWLGLQTGDPLRILRCMKFETVGFHPVDGTAPDLIEQVNQTWTYAVAMAAAGRLLELHPDAGGFNLAPGAHASQALDIMSVRERLVGAEIFAAVDPRNNRKLEKDLLKLSARPERHRYVFFMSPLYPGTKRLERFEWDGVQVWSIDA